MIPEPTSDLWNAVRRVYDSWPPDSEDVATGLAEDAHRFGTAAATGQGDLTRAGRAVRDAWRDEAGGAMAGKVAANGTQWGAIAAAAERQAAAARGYAQALTAAKTTISGTVASNEWLYELLGHTRLTAGLRTHLVNTLADSFQQLVTGWGAEATGEPDHPVQNGGTVGLCAGISVGFPGFSKSLTGCVIVASDGGVALTSSSAGGIPNSAGFSATGGVGLMASTGGTTQDQAGPFNHVEGAVGDEVGVSASGDWGPGTRGQPVYTGTVLVGLGAGASGSLGKSDTKVWEIIHGR